MTRRPLDLSGIMAEPKKKTPTKAPEKRTKPFKVNARRLLKYPYHLGAFFACLLLFLLIPRSPRNHLRHIQHIPCSQKRGVYTCSPPKGVTGDLVVRMDAKCALHVFSVGGLPFTHARWKDDMYRVHSAPHVQVMDAFPGCTPNAYVDSRTLPRERTHDLIWCAANDHRSFSVSVNGEQVLQDAGGALFSPEHNGVWTCFTYDNVPLNSEVHVIGDGHTMIHTYLHPDRVVKQV